MEWKTKNKAESKNSSAKSSLCSQNSWFVNSRCNFSGRQENWVSKNIDFSMRVFLEVNDMQIIMHVFTFLIRTRLRS